MIVASDGVRGLVRADCIDENMDLQHCRRRFSAAGDGIPSASVYATDAVRTDGASVSGRREINVNVQQDSGHHAVGGALALLLDG